MTEDAHYYFVPHHLREQYEALGWVFDSFLGPPHAAYSSLYRWEGEGEPKLPTKEISIRDIDPEIFPECAE